MLALIVWSRTIGVTPIRHARESVLKSDLQEMRRAIDSFTIKNQRPPQSLKELVDAELLKRLPIDPFTQNVDWVVVFDDVEFKPKQKIRGVVDVRSNSSKTNEKGQHYSDW
jgi:hypothetical protein